VRRRLPPTSLRIPALSLRIPALSLRAQLVIADSIRNPVHWYNWIPDQVRDDNCRVRDDNCGAWDDNCRAWDDNCVAFPVIASEAWRSMTSGCMDCRALRARNDNPKTHVD
jgi:hypothetical protein